MAPRVAGGHVGVSRSIARDQSFQWKDLMTANPAMLFGTAFIFCLCSPTGKAAVPSKA